MAAHKFLKRADIQEAIAEREQFYLGELGIRAERVLRETLAIATLDPRKLIGADGKPLKLQDLDDATAAAIAGLELEDISINGETGTRYKFKFWDKNKALDKLGQFKKLWDTKGPTVNVDARSVTNNTVHVGGGEAIRAVAELGRAIAAIGASARASAPDQNGPVLPAPIRAEQAGRGASVDAGKDQGSSGGA